MFGGNLPEARKKRRPMKNGGGRWQKGERRGPLKKVFLLGGVTQEREGRKKVDFSSFRWQRVKKW